MINKEVNVAIIGCGRIAGHHCNSIQDVDGIRLSAVCDLIEEKAKAYGDQYNVPWYTNYHQMLSECSDICTVVIASPSGMHYEHGIELICDYKKNLIIEKPTFMRPSHLIKAYQHAENNGVSLYPVFQNRYNKAIERVKKSLDENELGDIRIISVRVRWCRPQRYYDLSPWRGTFSHDGGALTNQGIHHIDLLRYLGGEVEQVNSVMRTLGADIEVEDTVVATIKYKDNSVGVLEVTTSARPDDFEASISIVGSKGLAQIGGVAVNELQIFTPKPEDCKKYSEDFSKSGLGVYGNGHKKMYKDIALSIQDNKAFPIDRDDCLETIKLLHSFYCSDETGNWVKVDSKNESVRLGCLDESISSLYRTKKF